METAIGVLILVLVVAVAIWLVNQIPVPAGLEIIRTVLIFIIVIIALARLFGFL